MKYGVFSTVFSIAVLALGAPLAAPAEAQMSARLVAEAPAFQPPDNPRAPLNGNTNTTGSRGDDSDDQATCATSMPITLLAPRQQVGQTASANPTLTWYVPAAYAGQEQDLYLYEYDSSGQTMANILWVSFMPQTGYITYQLPAEEVQLEPGKVYEWSVETFCEATNSYVMDEAQIEMVAAAAPLQQSLDQAASAAEQARLYGQAGRWYDAIAAVADGSTPAATALRRQLLEDLRQLEDSSGPEPSALALRLEELLD